MKAYFKPGWGVTFLVLGLALIILNFMLIGKTNRNPIAVVPGFLITFSGIMYLTRPVFELRATELVMFNLLGMEVKRYNFSNLSDFQVVDGKIFLASEGKSKRVRISKIMVKSADWDIFMRKITGEDITRELHNI